MHTGAYRTRVRTHVLTCERIHTRARTLARASEYTHTNTHTQLLDVHRLRVKRLKTENKRATLPNTTMIIGLLELHEKTTWMVETLFHNDNTFQKDMNSAFELIVNCEDSGK